MIVDESAPRLDLRLLHKCAHEAQKQLFNGPFDTAGARIPVFLLQKCGGLWHIYIEMYIAVLSSTR